jgi:hypothetical protein
VLVVVSSTLQDTSCCQSFLPFLRSKASSARRLPASRAWVKNTYLPEMMGVELPGAGNGAFQRTFSVALQWSGSSSSEIPFACGPRHMGQ